MITQSKLKEFLSYNKETGIFIRLKSTAALGRKGDIAGTKKNTGHICISIIGKRYLAHRLAWLYEFGEFPELYIDHKNGIPDDNRLENLRLATSSENICNSKIKVSSSTGFKGVSYNKNSNKYVARCWLKGKLFSLGSFDSAEKAHEAYVNKASVVHGEFFRNK
jgi:hypothetical protein